MDIWVLIFFGRSDTELIQITEKTLANEGLYDKGGLTNFSEIYLSINHHKPTTINAPFELLPALPNAWETGAFKGLVARGNFEIDVSWKNKEIASLSVTSGSGGICKLKYPNIENARITNANGDQVFFSKESKNLISFKTDKMDRYLITLE